MTERWNPNEPPSAQQIVLLERRWVAARTLLNKLLTPIIHDVPIIAAATGLSDASLLFDYTHCYIQHQRSTSITPDDADHITEVLLAAALTKLARIELGQDNDMTEFEKGVQ